MLPTPKSNLLGLLAIDIYSNVLLTSSILIYHACDFFYPDIDFLLGVFLFFFHIPSTNLFLFKN